MENINCAGCLRPIETRQFMICSVCSKKYDLICANVSEQRFYSTLTSDHRALWKCPMCVCKQPHADNSNTPLRSAGDKVMNRRVGALASPTEQADKSMILPLSSNLNTTALNDTIEVADVQLLFFELRQFREEYREDRATDRMQMKMLADSLEKINNRQDENDKKYERLIQRVDYLESKIVKQSKECGIASGSDVEQSLLISIAELKTEINERDQNLLLNEVEISCIVEQPGECLGHIAITLADKLGVKIGEEDLVSVTRVGPPSGNQDAAEPTSGLRPRPIVVHLARRGLRDQLLRAARVRRSATTEGVGLPGPPRRFYVNERLTKVSRILFRRTRELAAQHRWRFVWTRDGRIYVRQHQAPEAPRHRIRSEQDLVRVFGSGSVSPAETQ